MPGRAWRPGHFGYCPPQIKCFEGDNIQVFETLAHIFACGRLTKRQRTLEVMQPSELQAQITGHTPAKKIIADRNVAADGGCDFTQTT